MPQPVERPHLRIAMVAPPWYQVPPDGYGGIEAMVHGLAEGLAARDHDVTLIAAGAALTSARYLSMGDNPPPQQLGHVIQESVHALAAEQCLARMDLDVVHDHSMAGPLAARGRSAPTVVTVHGPIAGDLGRYYRLLADHTALVAISERQRVMGPDLPWRGMIHNAVPVETYPFEVEKEDWVLFLGRMGPQKRPDLAIEVARRAGRRIVVAGKCREPAELQYFEERVRPLLGPDAEWFGHADTASKKALLAKARCLVFPIGWDEPFGIVMVEAMACGTPVVALRAGSVPEVVVDGVTGYICDDPEELPDAIERADRIDPKACRRRVFDCFDVHDMVTAYERVYRDALTTARPRGW